MGGHDWEAPERTKAGSQLRAFLLLLVPKRSEDLADGGTLHPSLSSRSATDALVVEQRRGDRAASSARSTVGMPVASGSMTRAPRSEVRTFWLSAMSVPIRADVRWSLPSRSPVIPWRPPGFAATSGARWPALGSRGRGPGGRGVGDDLPQRPQWVLRNGEDASVRCAFQTLPLMSNVRLLAERGASFISRIEARPGARVPTRRSAARPDLLACRETAAIAARGPAPPTRTYDPLDQSRSDGVASTSVCRSRQPPGHASTPRLSPDRSRTDDLKALPGTSGKGL
jgi:hypothetical protein